MRLILGSERTQVTSENTVFAILEKWLSVDWDCMRNLLCLWLDRIAVQLLADLIDLLSCSTSQAHSRAGAPG